MSDKKVGIELSKGAIGLIANLLNNGYDTKEKELDDVFLYQDIFEIIGPVVRTYKEELKDKKDNEIEEITYSKVNIEMTPKQITWLSDVLKGIIKKGININEYTAKYIREIFTEIGQ